MFIIFGLGNPGSRYTYTRHNLGFLFLDYLQKKYSFPDFLKDPKLKSYISSGNILGNKVLLVKPDTFMNISGEAVSAVNQFYKVSLKDWIVVFDDISMDFGKIRIREEGSAGGHNGIKSIISHQKQNFKRIKFGVGKDENFETSDWVLSKFTPEEQKELGGFFEEIEDKIINIIPE